MGREEVLQLVRRSESMHFAQVNDSIKIQKDCFLQKSCGAADLL